MMLHGAGPVKGCEPTDSREQPVRLLGILLTRLGMDPPATWVRQKWALKPGDPATPFTELTLLNSMNSYKIEKYGNIKL
jgi:hypothetical protein